MIRDWASGGAIKVKRAKENIDDLAARIRAFDERDPYMFVVGPDPDTRQTIGKIEMREDVDPILGAIAADAIHNLRSVLDVLWRRATHQRPGKTDRRSGEYFPFQAAHVLEARHRRAKESSRLKRALKLACEIAPYEGGGDYGDLLCFLNEADRRDKHEVPTLVACRMGHLGDPSASIEKNRFILWYAGDMSIGPPLKHGEILWHGPASDPPSYMQTKIGFEVTFSKEGPFRGQPVLHQLTACTQIVESVVEAFVLAGLVNYPVPTVTL